MNKRDIFFLTFVSVAMFMAIVGCSFVMNVKRGGGRHLMALVVGAHDGALIAVTAASLVVIGSLFLRSRGAVGTQAVISTLLVFVHTASIYMVTSRIESGFEPVDSGVLWGQGAYIVAGALQAIAAVIGWVRYRRMPTDAARPPRRTTKSAGTVG